MRVQSYCVSACGTTLRFVFLGEQVDYVLVFATTQEKTHIGMSFDNISDLKSRKRSQRDVETDSSAVHFMRQG